MKISSYILKMIDPSEGAPAATRKAWMEKDRVSVNVAVKLASALLSLFHFIHLTAIDPGLNLPNPDWWFSYRVMGILTGLSCLLAHHLLSKSDPIVLRLTIMPAVVYAIVGQSMSMNNFDGVPYFFAAVCILLGVVALQLPAVSSGLLATIFVFIENSIIQGREEEFPYLLSAQVTAVIMVVLLQRNMTLSFQSHAIEMERQRISDEHAQLYEDFNNSLKEFLPGEVFRRIVKLVSENKCTPSQAVNEILTPTDRFVSCLFTDIRGYTKRLQQNIKDVKLSILPNVHSCVDSVEKHQGIPTTIGDAVFAYFDLDAKANVCLSLLCAIEIIEETNLINASKNSQIERFVSIASGYASVGNVGGKVGCFNITALGNCANLSQRLDEITKTQEFAELSKGKSYIIVDEQTVAVCLELFDRLQTIKFDLSSQNLKIRDFESLEYVYLLEASDVHKVLIREEYDQDITNTIERLRKAA